MSVYGTNTLANISPLRASVCAEMSMGCSGICESHVRTALRLSMSTRTNPLRLYLTYVGPMPPLWFAGICVSMLHTLVAQPASCHSVPIRVAVFFSILLVCGAVRACVCVWALCLDSQFFPLAQHMQSRHRKLICCGVMSTGTI